MTRTRRRSADDLPQRSATLRSEVARAETVAAALSPDDTDDVDTRVDDGAAIVEVERPTTSSLAATIDDAVVAFDVALDVATIAEEHVAGGSSEDEHSHSTQHGRSPRGDERPADDDATDGHAARDDPSDPGDTDSDDTEPDDT